MRKALRHLVCGPGGRKCPCCMPAPGSKERRYKFKVARRKEKEEAFKLEDTRP